MGLFYDCLNNAVKLGGFLGSGMIGSSKSPANENMPYSIEEQYEIVKAKGFI